MLQFIQFNNKLTFTSSFQQTQKLLLILTCDSLTCYKCISCVTRVTVAIGCMILYGTGGMDPTHPRTRVPTLFIDACKVPRTLGVCHAFRLALNVRVANVI